MSWVLLALLVVIGVLGGLTITVSLFSLVLVAIVLGIVISRPL